jgi:acylphosphatase
VLRRRVHLSIRGLVQGVFYRATTARVARELGLGGWVRNRPDGSVEVAAEGPDPALRELVSWCRSGPPGARVDAVEETWEEDRGEFDAFGIAR